MTCLNTRRTAASTIAGLVALSGLSVSAPADVEPQATMLRYPDVSGSNICFVYANDIWMVPRAGGQAVPMASPPGAESFPRFSPDGKSIAFVGNYDGGRDLYTLPLTGGIPTRVTHHPAGETLADWTPDGRLLYMTSGFSGLGRQSHLYTVAATSGLPVKMPVPYGGFGAVSPDGEWLAYTPHSTDTRTWKRYRGGMATDLWLFNLKDNTSKKITDWEGTDTLPMWVPAPEKGAKAGKQGAPEVLYYLSDNGPEHRLNIWSYTLKSGKREQVTAFKDDDVRWPSVGPGPSGRGEIVFQLGTELRLLDLATKKDSLVKVSIPGARPTLREKAIDASRYINNASVSPSGKRVVIEARGDVWSAPAKEGVVRNLTRTDGVFERTPAWSPDGKMIAYFSDESGEYELYVRPSDGRPAEKKDAKDGAKDDDAAKKDGAEAKKDDGEKDAPEKGEDAADQEGADKAKPGADAADEGDAKAGAVKAPPRKLTSLGAGFRYDPVWSPDSKHIVFTDKAGGLYLIEAAGGEPKLIDTDPWANRIPVSWSHDSRWLAYSRADDGNQQGCIWIYELKADRKTRVTSEVFSSQNPAFDRKGDHLYFRSNRAISSPMYSDLDETYIYVGTERLYMVPLRADVKNPLAPKSDEEEFKPDKDQKKDEKKDEKKDAEKGKEKGEGPDSKPAGETAVVDDGLSGTWEGTATGHGENMPPGGIPISLIIRLEGGSVTGSVTSPMGSGPISTGSFDKATGALSLTIQVGETAASLTGTVKGDEVSGSWSAGDASGSWSCKRTSKGKADAGADKSGDGDKDKAKEVKIDLAGFEHRAVALPVPAGSFGPLAVSDGNKLIYVRASARGSGEGPTIKVFDPADEAKEEKTVTAGGGFELSADGKKLMVMRGNAISIMDPAAGGGKSTTVPTAGMRVMVNPREEWKQIFQDAWRIERDFFYEPTMHGVDWEKMRAHYGAMIDDCVSREDVAFVLGEMISELNVGHAYVTSPGDIENAPSVAVGMLGCDFELVANGDRAAYRISGIHDGPDWDADARGPLSQPGVDIKVGEFVLAVNGEPVDTSKDPWAAFIDTADRPTTLTIGKNPEMDDQTREVLVKPVGSEGTIRFREWIERNRAYVAEKTGGAVGYIYVPNTGVDGQSELYRQFFGQKHKAALIIDERWNGGGQIPTRFIELLNRPVTNYWARRDGKDWVWPPSSHQGPKCMLINGLAGSGGDAFPSYFKSVGIGKLIGTRTWGGLVGISGNPGLMDGGAITAPTFGYYKTDGNWGIEGHGVDPDIEVIDDPAKMVNGGDPQLDRAIDLMLEEIKVNPYVAPRRPASPDRSGMGSKPEER